MHGRILTSAVMPTPLVTLVIVSKKQPNDLTATVSNCSLANFRNTATSTKLDLRPSSPSGPFLSQRDAWRPRAAVRGARAASRGGRREMGGDPSPPHRGTPNPRREAPPPRVPTAHPLLIAWRQPAGAGARGARGGLKRCPFATGGGF